MPPTDDPNDWELLLTRYVAGEATRAERARVEEWAASAPDHAAELDALRRAWAAGRHGSSTRFDARAAERSLERRLDAIDAERTRRTERGARVAPTSGQRPSRQVMWRVVGIAAAIAVVIAGGVLTRARWLAPPQQFREFASTAGSRVTITLRDGSRLVLGPTSRLRVPSDFGTTHRTVDLDGEVLFIVMHDAGRPFAVHTSRATVRDLGTTFVVHAYAEDADARVAVSEGEVTCEGVDLRAHDAASIGRDGRIVVERHVNVSSEFGWTQGALTFRDTPLRAVARELSRAYDIQVTIADSALGDALVTASVGSTESVDDVFQEITRAVGARYERTGRSVLIRGGSKPAREVRISGVGALTRS